MGDAGAIGLWEEEHTTRCPGTSNCQTGWYFWFAEWHFFVPLEDGLTIFWNSKKVTHGTSVVQKRERGATPLLGPQ